MNYDDFVEKQVLGYVISCICDDGNNDVEYLSEDNQSGGYWYWSSYILNANLYKSVDDALKVLDSSSFKHESKMSDGTIYPPHMVHSGARINISRKKGSVYFYIVPLEIGQFKFKCDIFAEIKEPK